jgi:hypothetical protein
MKEYGGVVFSNEIGARLPTILNVNKFILKITSVDALFISYCYTVLCFITLTFTVPTDGTQEKKPAPSIEPSTY